MYLYLLADLIKVLIAYLRRGKFHAGAPLTDGGQAENTAGGTAWEKHEQTAEAVEGTAQEKHEQGAGSKSVSAWLYWYVPRAAHGESVLAVMSLFALFGLPKGLARRHLVENGEAFATYQSRHAGDRLIEWQAQMKDIRYGKSYSADYNACEVIAAYNALVSLGERREAVSFPALLYHFERHGIVRGGAFGTSVRAVERYLRRCGVETKRFVFSPRRGEVRDLFPPEVEKEYDGFILTAYNDRNDLGAGVHTIYISKEDGGFVRHNDYAQRIVYGRLGEAVMRYRKGKSQPICLIALRVCQKEGSA